MRAPSSVAYAQHQAEADDDQDEEAAEGQLAAPNPPRAESCFWWKNQFAFCVNARRLRSAAAKVAASCGPHESAI